MIMLPSHPPYLVPKGKRMAATLRALHMTIVKQELALLYKVKGRISHSLPLLEVSPAPLIP
jgi:hypothetical protein